MGQGTLEPLRFELDGHDARPSVDESPRKGRLVIAAIVIATLGLLSWVLGRPLLGRSHAALFASMGAALTSTIVLGWIASRRRSARAEKDEEAKSTTARGRELVVDLQGVYLWVPELPPRLLFALDKSLGVALLSNRSRDRLVLAVTSKDDVLYVGSRLLRDDERESYLCLLSRATTIAEDDAVLDAVGSDGLPLQLRMRDLLALLEHLIRIDSHALDRCFLSDTAGTPVVLDGSALQIGRNVFDLASPLEWHGFLFQEPVGPVSGPNDWERDALPIGGVMVYQATWIRQGPSEAVLVSLLSSIAANHIPSDLFAGHSPQVQTALLRDLRLMQAAPDAPPPRELRIGIERSYMVCLRAALDRAPRAAHRSQLRSSP